ncbi:beta-1,3-galactosyltransferase 1-like [Eurosta solidaginis]|uniref:beta-1,3-galactosyltransferase 1-like n=1 Tax=Eurosta solidaginis TaxID=178769 RepID=UPI0035311807
MPAINAASLSIGALVGLVIGYGLWELAHAFKPIKKTTNDDSRLGILRTTFVNEEKADNNVTQLIDLYNFTYIMNQFGCTPNIHALVLVPSAPNNHEKRKLIRQTWANFVELPLHKNSIPFRVIFLLGLPETSDTQTELERENFEYDDIVQGSFVDSNKNMTYKHVMALKWFLTYCSNSQILIKVDDDVFLNTPQLMIYLHNSMLHNELPKGTTTLSPITTTTNTTTDASKVLFRQRRDVLICNRKNGGRVSRSYRNKWRVTYDEYPKSTYPPHCPGYGIIYTPDIVKRLYQAAQRTKYFWIDDVHITGTLNEKLNISIIPAFDYTYRCDRNRPKCDRLLDSKVNKIDKLEFLFSLPPKPEQMKSMWRENVERVWKYMSEDKENGLSHDNALELIPW